MSGDPVFVVVMGVSGCGKSTIGEGIAQHIDAHFKDGDELHPPANIDRMSRGIALTDDDRWPWLDAIRDYALARLQAGQSVVVACSALKKAYRLRLARDLSNTRFVYLRGSPQLIRERQTQREGHFMPASLIDSQFATLESPDGEANAVCVDIDVSADEVIASAVRALGAPG